MTEKHTHKLKRLKYKSGNIVFFCALPDCSFKTNIALALGKRSICWRCGKEFIMDEYNLRLAKPHCEQCHKSKKIVLPEPLITGGAEVIVDDLIDKVSNWSPTSLAEQFARLNQPVKEEEDEL